MPFWQHTLPTLAIFVSCSDAVGLEMGIHGIYKEIGAGTRCALSRLAVEKFEQCGRPLRIAIDTSIWLFQIQSGKGGTNH